jgi:hypothetical protein
MHLRLSFACILASNQIYASDRQLHGTLIGVGSIQMQIAGCKHLDVGDNAHASQASLQTRLCQAVAKLASQLRDLWPVLADVHSEGAAPALRCTRLATKLHFKASAHDLLKDTFITV